MVKVLGLEWGKQKPVESEEFNSQVHMRPHHLRQRRDALAGVQDGRSLAQEFVALQVRRSMKARTPDDIEYENDLERLRTKRYKEIEDRAADYFNLLGSLSNDAFIEFNLERDGICFSLGDCKHCVATNFQLGVLKRTAEMEAVHVGDIKDMLERNGSVEGVDFFMKPRKYTLFDYGGRRLEDPKKPVARTYTFDALIARVGAIRKLG